MIALDQNIVVGNVVETPGFHLNCKAVSFFLKPTVQFAQYYSCACLIFALFKNQKCNSFREILVLSATDHIRANQ